MSDTIRPSESLRACVSSMRARFDTHAKNDHIDEHGPRITRAGEELKQAARRVVAQDRQSLAGLSDEQWAALLRACYALVHAEEAGERTKRKEEAGRC